MIGGMTTFSGVATTGIYCRPGCGARPNPSNVNGFPTAAAAEAAGYRACLRCRPYRMAVPVPWSTGPEVVCRAVGLVLDGALDGATEDELGRRLGVSGRHLRRLFNENLGATPTQLARSARAHFARRLLDDTDLSVTDVAFRAGFGSVRQFNRDLTKIFRSSPADLRARRRVTDRLVADGGLPLRLPFTPPLDFQAMLAGLRARRVPGVEQVGDGVYRRTVVVEGDPGVVELGAGDGSCLVLTAHLPHWQGLMHIVQRARGIASLDFDLAAATERLGPDPVAGPLLRRRPGVRPPGTWDPFEGCVRAVITRHCHPEATSALMGRLVEQTGGEVAGLAAWGLSATFPTPQAVASADPDRVGLPGCCARVIQSLSAAVATGKVSLDRSRPRAELVASIASIGDLGCSTAERVALAVGEPDAFPSGDATLRRRLDVALATPISPDHVEQLSMAWRPFRALVATHLLDAEVLAPA